MTARTAVAESTTVRWGPIVLPAATEDGPGEVHNEIAGLSELSSVLVGLFRSVADYDVPKPCADCFVTGITPNLVLEDGTPANFNNGTMLHHVVNVNYSRPDITCPPGFSDLINRLGLFAGGNERFYAAGNERTEVEIENGYGYYVGSGDHWGLVYHLMNMSPYEKAVYFEYTFDWVPASADLKRTRPMWLDIDQCNDSEADVPAGYSDSTWDWEADRSGRIVTIGGHIHNYGISTAWFNETKDQNICTSVAGYAPESPFVPVGPGTGADDAHPVSANTVYSDPLGLANFNGNISDMTGCKPGAAGEIDKGDLVRLHAQIHRPDATDHDMGIMVAFMQEEFCLTDFWCL